MSVVDGGSGEVEAVEAGVAVPGVPVRLVAMLVAQTFVVVHVLELTASQHSRTNP